MKKMFLKKLMCLILSLIFSLSPVLATIVTFSSEDSDYSDCSDFPELPSDLNDVYYSGEEEEEEEEEEEDSPCIEYNQEYQAEEALETSENILFATLWKFIFEKYVFYESGFEDGSLYSFNGLYLNEDILSSYSKNYPYIYIKFVLALYSLANNLLNNRSLCYEEDIEKIQQAKNLAKLILDKKGISCPKNVFSVNFQTEARNGSLTLSAKQQICSEISNIFIIDHNLSHFCYSVNASSFKINYLCSTVDEIFIKDLGATQKVNFIKLNFKDLWEIIMKIYTKENPSYYQSFLFSIDLNDLDINYVRLLHELAINLKECDNLYHKYELPYLNATIRLTEDIAQNGIFCFPIDLSDDYAKELNLIIGELKNTTWEDNKAILKNICDILFFLCLRKSRLI